MSHGTDMIEGRSADVTHLAIHGKVTVKSNSKNFDLIFEYSSGVGNFDCTLSQQRSLQHHLMVVWRNRRNRPLRQDPGPGQPLKNPILVHTDGKPG